MTAKLYLKILFLVMISLSVASNWNYHNPICTKLVSNKFNIYRFDKNIQRVVLDEKIGKKIIFVCCEGYRERGRNKELPNCEPICKQSCGYGYCYRPNLCACYYGYEISALDGTCKRIGLETKAIPPTMDTGYRIETSTALHIDKKPSHSTVVADAGLEPMTTIRTGEQETEFENASTMEQTVFPRVKFVTYAESDLRTTPQTSSKIESFTKQIDLRQPLGTTDDFPRVKFIPHINSRPNIRSGNKSFIQIKGLDGQSYEPANCSIGICICQMGYQLIEERLCTQCKIGSQCQCQVGYAFDSVRCKPLCNGVFDGCIRGTCIGYNDCRCPNGTEKFTDDKFRCYVKGGNSLSQRKFNTKWCLLVLLIPVCVVAISFCFILKRSRSYKSNRLKAQRNHFQEIRYFHTNNNCCEQKLNCTINGLVTGGPGTGNQLDENILIVKV